MTSFVSATADSGKSPESVFVSSEAVCSLGLSLRAETGADRHFLRNLYISVRWPELAGVVDWTDDQKIAFLDQQFMAQSQHYASFYSDAEFLLIEHQGQAVGRLYLFRNSRDIRVVDISLIPEARNRGFATALLEALFAEGRTTNRSVSVHVEVFNPAQNLYRRLGFTEIELKGPYRLMEWKPEGQPA